MDLKLVCADQGRVVRIGQGLAVDARAGVDAADFPFVTFPTVLFLHPALKLDVIREGLEWWRRQQRLAIDLPCVANVGRELAAVRTLAPPQATVREQVLC